MERTHDQIVREHFERNRQMLIPHGPRQAGKTTTARANAKALGDALYLNFDNLERRSRLLRGPSIPICTPSSTQMPHVRVPISRTRAPWLSPGGTNARSLRVAPWSAQQRVVFTFYL